MSQIDPFYWTIDIDARAGSLAYTNELLKKLLEHLEKAETLSERLKKALVFKISSELASQIISIPSLIGGVISKLTDLATGFGKATIEAASMREQALAGFDALYKGSENSEELFQRTLAIAKLTKFETQGVVESFNALASAGFKAKELTPVFAAIADVASARGEGVGKIFQANLERIKLQGFTTLANFTSLLRTGTGQEGYLQIGKALGIIEKDKKEASIDDIMKVRKAISDKDKKVEADVAINAVLDAIREKFDAQSGELGSYAIKAGKESVAGLISNLKDSLQDTISGIDLEKTNFSKFKNFLGELNDFMMKDEESSKRFQALIRNLVDDVFVLFGISDDESGTKRFFTKVLEVAESLEKQVRKFFFWLRDTVIPGAMEMFTNPDGMWKGIRETLITIAGLFGHVIGSAISNVLSEQGARFGATLKEYLTSLDSWDDAKAKVDLQFDQQKFFDYLKEHPEEVEKAKTTLHKIGSEIGQFFGIGVAEGIDKGKPEVQDASKKLGQAAEASLRETTKTHSPSQKFAEVGKGFSEGIVLGMEQRKTFVDQAMTQVVDFSRVGHGGGMGPVSVGEVQIIINSNGSSQEIAEEVYKVLRDLGRYARNPSMAVR